MCDEWHLLVTASPRVAGVLFTERRRSVEADTLQSVVQTMTASTPRGVMRWKRRRSGEVSTMYHARPGMPIPRAREFELGCRAMGQLTAWLNVCIMLLLLHCKHCL